MKKVLILSLFVFTLRVAAQTSTGTVPIEIPIYTLKDGNFNMPISVSYNSAGIRVDESASNVGLNWNLNAGARIVRLIRDKPDEAFIGLDSRGILDQCGSRWHFWGYKSEPYPTYTEAVEDKFYFLRDLEPDTYILFLNGQNIQFTLADGGVEKNGRRVILLNENKDIFIEYIENEYNYLQSPVEANPTYQYQIDQLIHDYPKNLKERVCNGTFPFSIFAPSISFKVTDTDGTVYYFGLDVSSREYSFTPKMLDDANYFSTGGQPEKKEKHAVAASIISSPSAWLLSKTVKPKGFVQAFNKYKQEDKFQEMNFNYVRRMTVSQNLVYYSDTSPEIIDGCTTQNPKLSIYADNSQVYLEAHLSSIDSDNFQIKFNAPEIFALENTTTNLTSMIPSYTTGDFKNTKRLDVLGADYLPIKVNRNQNVVLDWKKEIDNPLKPIPTSELVRNMMVLDKTTGKKLGYYFDYEYYLHQNDKRQVSVLYPDEILWVNKRLKFKGLYPIEIAPTNAKLLNGYVFNYNPLGLPIKFTGAYDYWGYYNGKETNSIGLERVNKRNEATMAVLNACVTSNDRTPDIIYAQAGVLNQIINPTGGNIKYEYELHDSDNYYVSKVAGTKTGFRPIGGLRIKRLISYDPVANKEYITKFTYKKASNANESSGFLSILPNFDFCALSRVPSTQTTTGIFFTDPTNTSFKFIPNKTYNSISYNGSLMSKFINGNYITYREVKAEQVTMVGTTEVTNGSTVYEYYINEKQPYALLQSNGQYSYDVENTAVNGTCYSAYRYLNWNLPTYDFLKGAIKKVSIFKNGQVKPLTTTEYQYNVTDLTNVYNVKSSYLLPQVSIDVDLPNTYKGQVVVQTVGRVAGTVVSATATPLAGFVVDVVFKLIDASISLGQPYRDITNYTDKIYQYKMPIGKYNLNKVISTNYDLSGNMPVQTTTTYGYGTLHNEPTSITTITKNSDTTFPASLAEEKQETIIKYSREYNTTGVSQNEPYGLKLLNDRRFNLPVEIITKKNNLVISGNYRQFSPNLTEVGLEYTSYGLELNAPLSTFSLSDIVSGNISKNTNYVPLVNYSAYNTKGLVSTFNKYKAPSTQINYSYNQLLPTSITIASNVPAIAKTVNYEYDSPLFGIKKTTIPDGTFSTTEYDNMGRVKAIKDLNGNLIKSYNYNFVAKTFANISSDIVLQKKSGATFIDVKTLLNNDTFQSTVGEFLNIKVNTPSVVKSIVVNFDNKFVWKSNYVNDSNSFVLFGTTGFEPSILVNGSQKIGVCNVQVKLYSENEGRGDLIGTKNISFSIY